MQISDFICENRAQLIQFITDNYGNNFEKSDEVIEDFLINDEFLYSWAKSLGVDL